MNTQLTPEQRSRGEAFTAYLISSTTEHWIVKLCAAIDLNLVHPDAQILSAARDSLLVTGQRSNRWLRRAQRQGDGLDEEALRRLSLIMEGLD